MHTQLKDRLPHSPRRFAGVEPFIAVGVILLFTVFPLLPAKTVLPAVGAIVLLTIAGWVARWDVVVPLGVFCAICMALAPLRLPSQLSFALGLGTYWSIGRGVRWLHGSLGWLRVGSFTRDVALLTLASLLLSAASLTVWFLGTRPDITDILETFVPKWNAALLILGGLLFSMINAAVEEGAYRGVILDALDKSIGPGVAPVLLQAAAFGILHIRGFPRGWIGVGLSAIFGLLMAWIRRRSGGMLAPWIAHVCADCAIVGIVVFLARTP